jgi:hypothetical protein
MEEVEKKLAEIAAEGRNSSCDWSEHVPGLDMVDRVADWVQQPFMRTTGRDYGKEGREGPTGPADMTSWTGLGGYLLMAGIGVGVIAGEVIVGRIFGMRR